MHLAALGRFYSNPDLHIPSDEDHRYMVNVVSSAIVNKPPPAAIANLLARRNKIHHLNPDTDETLLTLFDKDPGASNKTANFNKVTMPSRNYAIITENSPGSHGTANGVAHGTEGETSEPSFEGHDGHSPLHLGEFGAGTQHKAASSSHGKGNDGSLDCCIFVEIDQHNPDGHTEPYGLTIPALNYEPGKYGTNEHHRLHLPHRSQRPGSSKTAASRPVTQASTTAPSTRATLH